jgi:hypothetical protein
MKSFLKFILFLFSVFLLFNSQVLAQDLTAPTIIHPTNADSPILAGQIQFRWTDTGASYYKYHINLPSGESRERVISSTLTIIYDLGLGDHSWAVASCSDSGGSDCSAWSATESFNIVSAPPELLKGLVPCGRMYDNPDTEIVESKPCQLTDIFVLLKLIFDFILWRAGPLVLVLLILTVGITSYFSLGSPDITVRAKRTLDSTIKGYIIIFFAWLLVNILLVIFGYRIGIFGQWWELRF